MVNVQLMEMRKKVKKELEYIPKGDLKQNMLRQLFFIIRMNSLGKKAKHPDDRNEVLKVAIEHEKEYWKKEGEIFAPKYDRNFFKI